MFKHSRKFGSWWNSGFRFSYIFFWNEQLVVIICTWKKFQANSSLKYHDWSVWCFFWVRSSGGKCLGKTWSVFWGMRSWILLGVELSKVLKIWYVCTYIYIYLHWIWIWIRLDPSEQLSPLVMFQGLQGEMSPNGGELRHVCFLCMNSQS